jgi:hypothetical protein
MPCRPVRNIAAQPSVVILLLKVRGIVIIDCTTISRASLFANSDTKSERNSVSLPTRGGDTFGIELTRDRTFGSSGLNLAFDGLLLGGELSSLSEGYIMQPPQVGTSSL